MATTLNLSLTVDMAGSTRFRTIQDQTGYVNTMDENLQKIDQFAGSIKGASGTVTLLAANWTGTTYSLTVAGLGDNDAIFFTGNSAADKTLIEEAGLFIDPNTVSGVVTITATTTPVSDIVMSYFITRG